MFFFFFHHHSFWFHPRGSCYSVRLHISFIIHHIVKQKNKKFYFLLHEKISIFLLKIFLLVVKKKIIFSFLKHLFLSFVKKYIILYVFLLRVYFLLQFFRRQIFENPGKTWNINNLQTLLIEAHPSS